MVTTPSASAGLAVEVTNPSGAVSAPIPLVVK
jgi:hypothetical protein